MPSVALSNAGNSGGDSGAVVGQLGDRVVTIIFRDKVIVAIDPAAPPTGTVPWLSPPAIDAHVHLALFPVGDELQRHGVVAAVDLASPIEELTTPTPGSGVATMIRSGPMLTRSGGYPLDAWGPDGYGIGCDDAACIDRTVDELIARGAGVIKIAIGEDGLDTALVPVAVAAAHRHHVLAVAHALTDEDARVAGAAGVDVLAHTPLTPLRDATIAMWRGRAVISTLAAFGGSPTAIENLRKLRAAGVNVIYGTDLGNLRADGVSLDEIDLLHRAGLDDAAIDRAVTVSAAMLWPRLGGALVVGAPATFLELAADPTRDARTLAAPTAVWIAGQRQPPSAK